MNELGTIGAFDSRTPDEKSRDFKFAELVSAPVKVELKETSPEKWKVYPKRNQDGSNTCVFQSRAKAAGILQEQKNLKFVEYSAADYNLRSNPTPGANPVEAFDLWRKNGVGLEALEPSQGIDDNNILVPNRSNFSKDVALVSTLSAYYTLPIMDFDIIISTLSATNKPIPICFYGSYEEWNRDIPTILSPLNLEQAIVRHSVCSTPNFGIWQGKEGFTIEDSWGSAGIAGTGVRWITREFMERNYLSGLVPTSFKNYIDLNVKPEVPRYTFKNTLTYGMENNPDVKALQDILKYEGLFPVNHSSTGNYFEITRRAIYEFQVKYSIATMEELNKLNGRMVGSKTIFGLNKLYGN